MDYREGPTVCKEECGTVVIKVSQFSNVSVHTRHADSSDEDEDNNDHVIDYDVSGYHFFGDYPVRVYPNGYDISTEGHVSLKLQYVHGLTPYLIDKWTISHFDLMCTVSVVDTEGCVKLRQSFAFAYDPTQGKFPSFLIDNYVSRNKLLTSADDLLPDDTLTLQVDVVVREHHALGRHKDISFFEYFTTNCKSLKGHLYVSLDSLAGEILLEESPYFKIRYETPMSEGLKVGKMPDVEYAHFGLLMRILWCRKVQVTTLRFSFQEILEVYALADFYGIEIVLDTCRRWLKLVCRTNEDASAVSRLADLNNDTTLQEIAEGTFSRNEEEGRDSGGAYPLEEQDEEWDYNVEEYHGTLSFLFKLRPRQTVSNDWQVPENVNEMSNCYS